MRPHHRTLGRHQVHRSALKPLQEHVPLGDYSRRGNASSLCSVLRVVAGAVTSPHAACDRLDRIACEDTIRKALYATLPESAALQRLLNGALAGRLPRAPRRRPQRLAIDLTLIAYHGEPSRDPKEVDRSPAEQGTRHFHAYATAYVVLRGRRSTVALTAVSEGEALKDVLRRPLKQARAVGARPRRLLLDRGSYGAGVIRYLQAARYPSLMPVQVRGRKADDPEGPSGTRPFALTARGGWHEYTVTGGDKRTARVSICVACRDSRGRWKRHGRQALVYACWGVSGRSSRGCGRRTGRGSGSSRAIGGWTGQGVGRRAGARRCGCCRWGSRRCRATSGCGCITRCCRRRVAGDGDCGRSGCGCERYCTGWCRWSKRHSGPWGRREWKGDHVEDL